MASRSTSRSNAAPYNTRHVAARRPPVSPAASATPAMLARRPRSANRSATSSVSVTPRASPPVDVAPQQSIGDQLTAVLGPLLERVERLESSALQHRVPEPTAPSLSTSSVEFASSPTLLATSTRVNNLPLVPARLRERITRGEFVDLDSLLPDVVGADLEEEDSLQLHTESGRAVHLVSKSATSSTPRRRVHDVATWLEAFTVYSRVVLDAAPDRAQMLLAYQATILQANNNYQNDAWLTYDRGFRRALATLPDQYRWDTIDPNLWQAAFTSRGRPVCSRCSIIHPIPTPQCPFRGGLPSNANANQGGSQFRTPFVNGKPICRNFNKGLCSDSSCPRAHFCLRCRGKHAESDCRKSSSSK